MKTFYAKIKINYRDTTPVHMVSVRTFGNGVEDAKFSVESMVSRWEGISYFAVIKISSEPINLIKYMVEGIIKYKTGKTKKIKFTINAENEPEAHQIFKEIINPWKGIASTEITKTEIHFKSCKK